MLNIKNAFSSFAVKDLKKARQFYGEAVGLPVSETPEGLEIKTPGTTVFIYPKPQHTAATYTVLNFSVDNVEQAVNELTGRGVKFEIYNDPDIKTDSHGIHSSGRGPKIAWFKDPDGNILSVLEAM